METRLLRAHLQTLYKFTSEYLTSQQKTVKDSRMRIIL